MEIKRKGMLIGGAAEMLADEEEFNKLKKERKQTYETSN